jgi:hypothetical protein
MNAQAPESPSRQQAWHELSRFLTPLSLVETSAESAALAIPPAWVSLLEDGRRATAATSYWKRIAAYMPQVAAFLECNLQKLFVLDEQDSGLSLLYAYWAGGDLNFYQGRPPLSGVPGRFHAVWERLPEALRYFYLHIHNGWTFLPGNSMGPLPVEDWRYLSDDGFDIDDSTAAALPIDIARTLAVFHNGAGDYLCLDCSAASGEATGVIWWHDDPEKPEVVDFRAVLDAWIGIFLEEADPA